jgi:peptidoglycan L-alanyl-D-glutamate endopeptidase CwlK
MKDSRDINLCHEDLIIAFSDTSEIFENRHPDIKVICTQSYRSPETQNNLYAQGRTKEGPKVTNAKGGESPHNYLPALAFDVAFTRGKTVIWDAKYYKEFAELVEARNPTIRWGGDWDGDGRTDDERFPDRPHFEMRNWRNYIKK